jgi:hypothetical protein
LCLFNLIATDVGRPLGDIVKRFTDDDLLADAQQLLRDLRPREKEVRTEEGRWFARRILPYRTLDNRIDGVVKCQPAIFGPPSPAFCQAIAHGTAIAITRTSRKRERKQERPALRRPSQACRDVARRGGTDAKGLLSGRSSEDPSPAVLSKIQETRRIRWQTNTCSSGPRPETKSCTGRPP